MNVADNRESGDSLRPRVAPIISAALFLVTAALFLYSFSEFSQPFGVAELSVSPWRGELMVRKFSAEPIVGDAQNVDGWGFMGLSFYRMTHVTGYSSSVTCPMWLLMLIFGILPIREGIRLMRVRTLQRRNAAGQCIQCGYDLRGSTGRCPECGTATVPIPDGNRA